MKNSYPILEFDPERKAIIEPAEVNRPLDVSEYCVVSFFKEVIDKVAAKHNARVLSQNRWEDGPHPLYEIEHNGRKIAFFHPGVGAALAAGLLEEVIAFGCRKFIACGGCGVLQEGTEVGNLIVVTAAVRDEGVSYHYLAPGREVVAQQAAKTAIEAALQRAGFQFLSGKTWTTDAPYRETPARIAARRSEGCLAVEMEAAALMAVAEFRDVQFGQVLYAGDDLSGSTWDNRGWQSRGEVREHLFWLAVDACLSL